MRRRIAIGLGVCALAVIPLLAAWVPPYGGGSEQLFVPQPGPAGSTAAAPPPMQGAGGLQDPGWVYGTARDPLGNPIPYAKVVVERIDKLDAWGPLHQECDGHGRFRALLKPGTWSLGFAGGSGRIDTGTTRVLTLEQAAHPLGHRDLQLEGTAALLAEVQVEGLAGLYIECDLIDAQGEVVASGRAIGAEPCFERVALDLREALGQALFKPEATRGQALCFEGLPAGDYRLRVHLNREQGLTHEHALQVEDGAVVDLGRLNLGAGDFGPDAELEARYFDRERHEDPRTIYCFMF